MNWRSSKLLISSSEICPKIQCRSHLRIPVSKKFTSSGTIPILFASRGLSDGLERIYEITCSLDITSSSSNDVKLVLDYSKKPGTFDDNGACPCTILDNGSTELLYYCGWNIHKKVPFSCAIGLAKRDSDSAEFTRVFEGPILDRNPNDPLFVAVCDVFRTHSNYSMFYLSCKEWAPDESSKMNLKHMYAIKEATSADGIRWETVDHFVIDHASSCEYAISTPRIIEVMDYLICFYSYRESSEGKHYKIGMAVQKPNGEWIRMDSITASIRINSQAEPREVCYPWPIIHENLLYLLHNGSNYGEDGIWVTSIAIPELVEEINGYSLDSL